MEDYVWKTFQSFTKRIAEDYGIDELDLGEPEIEVATKLTMITVIGEALSGLKSV